MLKSDCRSRLPEKIKFCSACVMTNQLPKSEVEHTHNKVTKKKTIDFHDDGKCAACHTT